MKTQFINVNKAINSKHKNPVGYYENIKDRLNHGYSLFAAYSVANWIANGNTILR